MEINVIQYLTHVDLFESEEGMVCESSNVWSGRAEVPMSRVMISSSSALSSDELYKSFTKLNKVKYWQGFEAEFFYFSTIFFGTWQMSSSPRNATFDDQFFSKFVLLPVLYFFPVNF